MDPSANYPMGGFTGDSSFLRDPSQQQQPQLSPYGGQAQQAPPQQTQTQLQPSIFTQMSPNMQQQQQQQASPFSNQYRQEPQLQQQQPMMQSTQYQQQLQQQQTTPYSNQYRQEPQIQQQQPMMQSPQYQQQQQQQQASPYNFSPPPQPPSNSGSGGNGMGLAQRSAMMQQQVGGGSYGNYQQQQKDTPPVSQINVPTQQPQQQAPAPGSYAQRYQAMQQQQQTQQQPAVQSSNNSNIYSTVASGSDNLYPPSPKRQQSQQQPGAQQQTQQQPAPGSFAQRQAAMLGQGQPQNQQQAHVPGSFAQRQAGMLGQTQNPPQQVGGMMPQQQQQQQFQQPGQPRMQQQFQQPQQAPPQPPQRPMLVDPPEVIAQQQRLLTDATRKVQEHAYYMKQAIDRHDLPVVLERAACIVGELGEHAHSHNNHKLHPPAPGTSGTSTALQPKNYYELHLRTLEELPTLENYLLDVANASKQQGQLRQPQPQPVIGGAPPPAPVPLPVPVPSSGNSAALMQQLTGDPNPMSGGNFVNPPQPNMNSNLNYPLEAGPGVYTNVMGGNGNTMNSNPMMANVQNPQMGMGMTNSGMRPRQPQQPMMNNTLVPPAPAIKYTMMDLYNCVQYCPVVLSRLYLQICAASALIRSGEVGARWVFRDLIEAVKCVQNPVRGLFLRHYLLQAFRDKLPDIGIPIDQIGSIIRGSPGAASPVAPTGQNVIPVDNALEPGTVKDSYEFVLANFIEMNKLWVRIQHLPGDQRTKMVRRRREKDRNELRILVGTNLVRLSALDSVTSTIYGQVILPTVLDQIVICADPLSQAYLLDCIVQVFPDEYHIETMPILLAVCPKLRDKVNIRTILHSLMTRLANYLADEELLDEKDLNQVKRAVALDSFRMFDECVQNVYNARGPKLNAKEVIRLQTALLEYSMKCYKGNIEQITLCLKNCVVALQQARDNAAYLMPPPPQQQQYGQPEMPPPPPPTALEAVATKELEKLLSIPLDELSLGVLNLDHYSDLIAFLPWSNHRELALNMLESVINTGKSPDSVKEVEEIFTVIAPVIRGENDNAVPSSMPQDMNRTTNLMAGLGITPGQQQQAYPSQQQQGFQGGGINPIQYKQDSALVSKFIGMLDNTDTDILFEMLSIALKHLNGGQSAVQLSSSAHEALVFASLELARRVFREVHEESSLPAVVAEEGNGDAENISEEEKEVAAPAKESDTSAEDNGKDEEEGTENKVETVQEDEKEVNTETAEKATENDEDTKPAAIEDATAKAPKSTNCRQVFVYILETIRSFAHCDPERGIKLYLQAALAADQLGVKCGSDDEKQTFGTIANELLSLSFSLYETRVANDTRLQRLCIIPMIGTLMACRSLAKSEYEGSIATVSKFSAKIVKQSEQCEMVTRCAHLFYVVDDDGSTVVYANPQRSLECLQRALKLANACTSADVRDVKLFVDLFDVYLYFFEKNNPSINGDFITGLAALIKEHSNGLPLQHMGGGMNAAMETKNQFLRIVRYIKVMKDKPETAEKFKDIDVSAIES